jgi:hypothetical protein
MKTYQALGKLKNQVLEVIVKVAVPSHIKWHEPTFDCNAWTYLKECPDSTYVSLAGKFVSDLSILQGLKNIYFHVLSVYLVVQI